MQKTTYLVLASRASLTPDRIDKGMRIMVVWPSGGQKSFAKVLLNREQKPYASVNKSFAESPTKTLRKV